MLAPLLVKLPNSFNYMTVKLMLAILLASWNLQFNYTAQLVSLMLYISLVS